MKPKNKATKKLVRESLPFTTDKEYRAWLLANPRRAEAMVDLARNMLEEKRGKMSLKKQKEMQELTKEFADQIAGLVVPSQFNAMTGRINKLIKQDRFSHKDIEELETAEEELSRLINMGLDMKEPSRTKAMKVMLHAKQQVRLVLDNLQEQ